MTSFTMPHPPNKLTIFLIFINGISIVYLCSNSESFFNSWRIGPNQWRTTLRSGRFFIAIVRFVIFCRTFFLCEAKAFIGIIICIYDQLWLIFKSLNAFNSYRIINITGWKCRSAKGTGQSLTISASVPQCLGTEKFSAFVLSHSTKKAQADLKLTIFETWRYCRNYFKAHSLKALNALKIHWQQLKRH